MLAAGLCRSFFAPIASRLALPQLALESSSCAARALDSSTSGSQSSFLRCKHDSATRYGTTVLCVRKGNQVVMIADGQVTQGYRVMKPNAKKIRRLSETVVGGFAGATADALTLFERLENKLEEHSGQLKRAAVELAKAWRQDRVLRRLEASMLVADAEVTLEITGDGDVLEPHDGVLAIGSGGGFALAAARALIDMPDLDAKDIALKSMNIAADICVMTNHNFTIEVLQDGKLLDPNTDSAPPLSS